MANGPWGTFTKYAGRFLDPGGLFKGAPQADAAERDPWLEQQQRDNLGTLQDWAYGNAGPSAAELQMQQGAGMAARQAMGQAAGQTGLAPAMAARYAQQAAMEGRARANEQAGILRAQEMANYMNMYNQALAGMSADDLRRMEMENQLNAQNANIRQVQQGGILSAAGGLIGGLI